MKHLLKFIFFTILLLVISNCAKTGRPEGGPKDETAPLVITSKPPYKTVNFNKNEIEIQFDEFIKLKEVNTQLIISPPLKTPPVITPQGTASKFINIKILDTLQANTTYIFNFGNAIQDNNENNTLEAFKYIFSTGSYIDSLTTSGSVKDAYFSKPPKNINILLYKIDTAFTDSIVFKKKPNYVTNTLDSVGFKLTNLKKGNYLMVALQEEASDYIYSSKTDKIGFYPTPISLPKDSITNLPITIFKEKAAYKIKTGKEDSKGKILFTYEGELKDFKVNMLSKTPTGFKSISKFEKGKDTLNYWFTPFEADSLNFVVSNDTFLDTLTVRLRKNKIDSLIVNATINNTFHFRDTFFLKTNNPIIALDTDKISITDKDTIAVPFKSYIDATENKIAFLFDKKQLENYTIKVLPKAFSDIFEHKNDTLQYNLKTKELEDYGKITLTINNDNSKNLIIEVLEGKDNNNLIERVHISKTETIVLDLLEPKTYFVRAIVDSNKNKKWDTGNYLKKQLPEEIIYYKEALEVRANYFIENTFTVD